MPEENENQAPAGEPDKNEQEDTTSQKKAKEEQKAKDDEEAKAQKEKNQKGDDETKPLLKVKNPFDESVHTPTVVTDPDTYHLTPCCCCLCACSHERVGSASCFGCFPIRCGIVFIAIFIFVLALSLLITTFFGLLNEYLPWWFVFVQILLLMPLIVSASIAVYFFSKDKRSTRGKLRGAAIMSIISVFLWAVWQLIFYLAIYKRDTVYSGFGAANDDSNYTRMGKKQYIFTFLAEAFVIMGFLAYFVAVSSEYVTLMNAPHEAEKKREEDEAKAKKDAADDLKKQQNAGNAN